MEQEINHKEQQWFGEAAAYLTELMAAAFHNQAPRVKPDTCTWEQVFWMAKSNGVAGLTFYGLELLPKSGAQPEDALYQQWKKERDRTVYHQLYFDLEREGILQDMEAQGLSYMVLKGVLLQPYYPQAGMRAMSDNDILFGFIDSGADGFAWSHDAHKSSEEARRRMQSIMEKRGYVCVNEDGGVDEFHKDPFYNFEMHRQLMHSSNVYYPFYQNPWKHSVRQRAYSYAMTAEEEYLYLLVHAAKHYENGGCGFRFLADLYVYLAKKQARMDWAYVENRLEEMGLQEFEARLRELTRQALGTPDGAPPEGLDEANLEFLYYLVSNGLYGTQAVRMQHKIERKSGSKWQYLWNRIMPTKEQCEDYYPFFANRRYLLPFYFVYRVLRGVICKPGKLWNEVKLLMKTKTK